MTDGYRLSGKAHKSLGYGAFYIAECEGDYPGLDRRRKTFIPTLRQGSALGWRLKWLWLALTIVILAIEPAKSVETQGYAGRRQPLVRDYFEAKLDSVSRGILKNVVVINPSPSIPVVSTCKYFYDIGDGDKYCGSLKQSSRAHDGLLDFRRRRVAESIGKSGWQQNVIQIDQRMSDGGLASIFQPDIENKAMHTPFDGTISPHSWEVPPLFHHNFFNVNVSSQLAFGGFSRIAPLTENQYGQRDSGEIENNRKYGERIIESLAEKPRQGLFISFFIGLLCVAIGIAFNIKGRGKYSMWIGGIFFVVGLLTPIFPWWAFILVML